MSEEVTAGLVTERLKEIESAIRDGSYRPGRWQKLVAQIRTLKQSDRQALAADISRVSRCLHSRRGQRKFSFLIGLLIETWAGILGGLMVASGIASQSNFRAVVGMILMAAALQPLLKVSIGTLFGVHYDYVYLYWGFEPRFKMSYGSYLAIAPLRRSLLHFSGMIGTPLAALVVARITAALLPTASIISWSVFWLTAVVNIFALILAVLGIRRFAGIWLPEGSPTSAIIELRDWLGIESAH